ncbi:LLM class flavin-dependent oxidoreductase [Microbacterium rhizomatis]|uniref:LLM class flavin-dependent oxidoreductase n=1 Tax=Microbacterium rhizomatis TaxID=1631477 RepID=A0A5J5IY00_9MICO|nr:LLM class flavin-dependent oxidoreductase [Microbacterium rhizomatis]KAA9106371.1 LLM class flavin-dependent oxidoreductase [Microbacterium rhizomatis]
MTESSIRIVQESWDGAAATALRARMDEDVHPRYADLLRDGSTTPPPVQVDDVIATLVAYDGDEPVGTASLKRTGPYAEVKRVFIETTHRRTGLAARLLAGLEEVARSRGILDLVLQTGARQPEAIALYEREGWTPIAPFGPYADDGEISRCFAKPLQPLIVGVELPAGANAGAVPQHVIEAILAADAADFIVLTDGYLAPEGSLLLDAGTLATFAAPRTRHAVLVPVITATHTEPFHVAKVIQTLDFVSRGRAGWQPGVETDARIAALFGRKGVEDDATLWAEADEVIDVVSRLWDSWEDDAEIRDVETGRFIDRDRVHHIDFVGRFFSVKGPSIVPRSPQGQPPIVLRVDDEDEDALAVAAARADVIRVSASGVARARDAVRAVGREGVAVIVELPASASPRGDAGRAVSIRQETGADGAVIVFDRIPAEIRDIAEAVRGTGSGRGGTFRDRLGLIRPASRYVREGITA